MLITKPMKGLVHKSEKNVKTSIAINFFFTKTYSIPLTCSRNLVSKTKCNYDNKRSESSGGEQEDEGGLGPTE